MHDPPSIVVVSDHPDCEPRAQALAQRLTLPFLSSIDGNDHPLVLAVTPRRLELRDASTPRSRPVYVDFVGAPGALRRLTAGGRKQPIARAVGIRGVPPLVLDATAGLGRDAFLLAALGCRVLALERSPPLAVLLGDGLRRGLESGDRKLATVVDRIRLIEADAIELLKRIQAGDAAQLGGELPDVVYLDPMYPPSSKSAQVKKEMRVLRRLVGDDPDASDLLSAARQSAAGRVVVKRLRHAPALAPDVSHSIAGTRVRYDVYLKAQGR